MRRNLIYEKYFLTTILFWYNELVEINGSDTTVEHTYQNLIYKEFVEVPSSYSVESYYKYLLVNNDEYDCLSKCNSNSKCIYSHFKDNVCNLYDYRAKNHMIDTMNKKHSYLFQKLTTEG